MPELRECYVSGRYLQEHFLKYRGSDWSLERIWYDARDIDQKASPEGSRLSNGLVDILTYHDKSEVVRGTTRVQTPLWPPLPHVAGKNELHSLQLQEVKITSRTVVLNFGPLWLQVQYLTHTSPQIYRKATWDTSIRDTPKEVRTFRIGVAFEFHEFVVAFVTRDLVFQLTWAKSEVLLPYKDINVFEDWTSYLKRVVEYLKKHEKALSKNKHTKLAIVAIREMRDLLAGIGVYSAPELMFTAGLSPTLTVNEVFWNPSRLARLLEAIYCFMASAVKDLWPTVKKCIRDCMIVPTANERELLAKYLRVYAKETVFVSERLADLVGIYNVPDTVYERGQQPKSPFDPFEPTFLQRGLESEGHLGHLIFGQEKWRELCPSAPAKPMDPLTVYFRNKGWLAGMFKMKEYLDLDRYTQLFLDQKGMRARLLPTFTYREVSQKTVKKQMWTVHLFSNKSFKQITDVQERKKMTFRYILEGKDVAVGPLEYCGNGVIIKKANGRIHQCAHPVLCLVFFSDRS
ncbi:hypothetical protein BV25DRAFT_1816350 [Artomyces pyxidatus]|uniref:Uncharacterized protein n=1 Tax=Artomyces pyxidatus TaxID=48021 RepID=A0ACB8SFA7_9AGAM|nr:hypothetical protein BV25DRAFT_1816350 [Artomyces pyxidatus]